MTGNVLREDYPGHGLPGGIISKWLRVLHTGAVFGLACRVLIVMIGIVVAILSITGVVLWWKKRQGRRFVQSRRKPLDQDATI
ncbi:PepSY domain-containing protein [Methylophilus sp. OH31]|uniref:PepSY domain-containing protein n=1 Tax=Methylophilus sp. OH31 TaxID=1387312 RepID=UPI000463A574|nr:PepSY-associated TM helix domain-containing protein [Methylophilus sp. OH31]